MEFIDTHTHIYVSEFEQDIDIVIQECLNNNVNHLLLPNINMESISPMLTVCAKYAQICYPMLGLHPCDVNADYKNTLKNMFALFEQYPFIAIGEIGIDLYWDKTFIEEQKDALRWQIDFAIEKDLPIIIHKRQSYYEVMSVLDEFSNCKLRGIFHCYSGSVEHAQALIDKGFLLGIGGTVTYKSAKLDEILPHIDLQHIVLETDSPYLPPVPYRGQRNKSSYIPLIAQRIAEIKQTTIEQVAEITTNNAKQLFKI